MNDSTMNSDQHELQPQPRRDPGADPEPDLAAVLGRVRARRARSSSGADRAARPSFDPALRCRNCASSDLTWEASAGNGTIYSWTAVWRPQQPSFIVPYAPAIIDMDEGYQILANIVGCDVADLAVGMRVAVEFHPVSDGVALPYFRPV